jgi:pantoate--beta-alanine ligase
MQIVKSIKEMQTFSRGIRAEGKTIGFVPTMGALHEGHLSLVSRSKKEHDITVVSIFVNPEQFGFGEDFNAYPRDTEGDIKKLSTAGVEIVFSPDKNEMYPDGFSTSIDIGNIGRILCGASRPGHFNGVATVVTKLFHVVMPHTAYFGQKDFQQTVVMKKLVRDLNFDIDIVVCPIVRESDGLAMSSRNSYLKPDERKRAAMLYRALKHGEDLIKKGRKDTGQIKSKMARLIQSEKGTLVEYIEIVDPQNLDAMEKIRFPAVICLAARIGTTRLIDNLIFREISK